jgi:hypothetical protein
MDGDFFWLLVIAFFVIVMVKGGKQGRSHRRMREQLDQLQATPPAPPPALPGPTRAEVERLEQRVRVLERIVTDSGYSLASQIEALRDRPPVEAQRATSEIEEKI